MLRGGEDRSVKDEFDRLVGWIRDTEPDVVHLSNALLLGIAPAAARLGIPVTCSLQDEHTWLDELDDSWSNQAWSLMEESSRHVDLFLPVSEYYSDFMKERLSLTPEKLRVVPLGVDCDFPLSTNDLGGRNAIGYMAHICEANGFGVLCDAFIRLRSGGAFPRLRLRVTGGATRSDSAVVRSALSRVRKAGLANMVEIVPAFGPADRRAFLNSIDLLSVPVSGTEAFGVYLAESMAAGVPVVQPDAGGFSEFVSATGGGVLYSPNDADQLADSWADLLADPGRIRELGHAGSRAVRGSHTVREMVDRMTQAFAAARDLQKGRA